MADLFKIRRGDVFYCEQKAVNNNSVENKTRPVVVVSNDKGNTTSTTCVVCPITSRDHTVIPAQVLYHSGTDKQVVLCEQIKTVAISSLTRYIGYLSKDVMDRVDEALRIQLGLSVPEKSYNVKEALDLIEKSFDELIKSKEMKQDLIPESKLNDIALKIANSINDKITPIPTISESVKLGNVIDPKKVNDTDIPNWETIVKRNQTSRETEKCDSPTNTESPQIKTSDNSSKRLSQIEKFNKKYDIKEEPKSVPKKSVPKGRIFADEDEARQFVKDCETMSISEVCTKYGITPKQLYNNRYLYKKKFANENR